MHNLKIGIVGHGYVGKAIDFGFTKNVDKKIIDPNNNTSTLDLKEFNPDVVFISVPTPMSKDGRIDSSIILTVLEEIKELNLHALIVIKSSVTPSELKKCKKMSKNLVYNPEFLTERNANLDFINPDALIIGGPEEESNLLKKYYLNHSNCSDCPIYITDIYTASIVKYTINVFLATKVLFMNEIYEIFNSSEAAASWEEFTNILASDSRIGNSHLRVPGIDGKFGFGGACFPKDIQAFFNFAEGEGVSPELIKKVIAANNKIRSQYSDLDAREIEQNISFKTED